MSDITALLADPNPFAVPCPVSDATFEAAMAECDRWHLERNEGYARLWDATKRPCLPVGLFKKVDLATRTENSGAWLTSSASSGVHTRMHFDELSVGRIRAAMWRMFMHNGFIEPAPANFLLLAPDPSSGDHPGYATAFEKFTACAPNKERVFAVGADGLFDAELAWNALERFADDDAPTFIFGLTVFFERLALSATRPLTFQGQLKGLTGGGWKGLTQTLTREAIGSRLKTLLREKFDLRDLFGMTEHALHYISCSRGAFHVPRYARFSVVGPDGKAVADGSDGLLCLRNPFFASAPVHDIRTSDLGVRGRACPCGDPLPFFRFRGRVSAPTGTCAAEAMR